MFEIEPMPQPVQECMLFLAFMSFSVIVCLYQHINVLHEKAKLHDDSRLTVFVTLPTDSESAAFNARNTLFQSEIVYTVFIKTQHFWCIDREKR